MKLLCWNVNGIRAIAKKGFFEWMEKESPDILCIQETKAHPDQLEALHLTPPGYQSFWAWAERPGYSGVAIYAKTACKSCAVGIEIPRFDCEGRTLVLETERFTLINGYFPNGSDDNKRVPYKLAYSDAVLDYAKTLERKGHSVIICGDLNTAHREIDIARPKENAGNTGFLPIERAWMDKLVASGYIDIFRQLHPEPSQYTWWSYRMRARERNIGWRIDYFFITPDLVGKVKRAYIESQVMGSDHCPIGLELAL